MTATAPKRIPLRYLITLAVVGWLIVLWPVIGWVHARYIERPFLTYQRMPWPVTNSPVAAGTEAAVHIWRCSTDPLFRTFPVSRVLDAVPASAADRRMLPVLQGVDPGCSDETRMVQVPFDTAPGLYRITGIAEPAGTVRTFSVPFETDVFEVIKGANP